MKCLKKLNAFSLKLTVTLRYILKAQYEVFVKLSNDSLNSLDSHNFCYRPSC